MNLKPGQLYVWAFTVGDGTWWLDLVTEEARTTMVLRESVFVKRGDQIMLVTVDDPGPFEHTMYETANLMSSEFSDPIDKPEKKRYHVALCRNQLIWISEDRFSFMELISDVV